MGRCNRTPTIKEMNKWSSETYNETPSGLLKYITKSKNLIRFKESQRIEREGVDLPSEIGWGTLTLLSFVYLTLVSDLQDQYSNRFVVDVKNHTIISHSKSVVRISH
jgi:hypothetical protein